MCFTVLTLTAVRPGTPEAARLQALYVRAFPPNERRPLEPLMADQTGHAQVLAAMEEGQFRGFVCSLIQDELLHIIYFAVEEDQRGRGLGSRILSAVREEAPGMRILVDIEVPDPAAENNAQRVKRLDFYLRNGYAETPVRYSWQGENYVILAQGGSLTPEEFHRFWNHLSRSLSGPKPH